MLTQQSISYGVIGHNIIAVDKYFRMYLKNSLKTYGMNAAEGMVLLALSEHDGLTEGQIFDNIHESAQGITQEQLVCELHYDKSVMTRTMQSLEGKGYVTRFDNPKDSRSFVFNLTESGSKFKTTLTGIMMEWTRAVLDGFDDTELALMSRLLSRLENNARTKSL